MRQVSAKGRNLVTHERAKYNIIAKVGQREQDVQRLYKDQ